MRYTIALALLFAACGEVTPTGPGGTGNDVPSGPAVAAAGQGNDCTRPTGAGVDATVTPGTGGYPGQGAVVGTPPQGLDPAAPPCFDFTTQALTTGGNLLTTLPFAIKDGVVQAPADGRVRIVTQWFLWSEPTSGTCNSVIFAVVEVTDAGTTCAAELIFGDMVDSPVYTYPAGP